MIAVVLRALHRSDRVRGHGSEPFNEASLHFLGLSDIAPFDMPEAANVLGEFSQLNCQLMILGRQRRHDFLQKLLVVRQDLAFHATLCGTAEWIEACAAQAFQSPQQAEDREYPRTERPLARLHGARRGSKEGRGREQYFEPCIALKGLLQGIQE